MKKALTVIGFLSILMVSFQNCSSRNFSPNTSGDSSSPTQNKSASTVPTADFNKLVLWDNAHQQILDVNLETGEMTAFEDYGNVRADKYCLSPSELTEVKTILNGASVCIPDIDFKEVKDRACTMLYQYPYASLANQKEEIRLGEKTSGCDQSSDLCEDRGPMLKNFSTAILKNLADKKCK